MPIRAPLITSLAVVALSNPCPFPRFRPAITKAERQGNYGHVGRFLKLRRGLYDAVCVQRDRVYDVINMFDRPVSFSQLWRLRFQVFMNSLF